MDDDPKDAVKTKKDASLVVGVRAVADGRADAMVSGGNTGASILACAKHFTLLPGIRRAALASVYPRSTEYPGQDALALLLDAGATVHCEPTELVHFALMGSAYARRISKVPSPRVGLLNMGREETKGGEVLVETHRRLKQLPVLNFVGNVALKLFEGVSELMTDVARAAAERRLMWRLGLRLLSQGIEKVQALTDYSQYGGSPILGFEQLFIKCHGRSQARAVANAVKVAAKAVRDRVPAEIADALHGNGAATA
jgi:glycerol-3-phosphate acyltransferase PlsX